MWGINWEVQGKRTVLDEDVVWRLLEIVVGSETEVIVLLLGRRVNPPPLIPCEGAFFVVVRDDVLTQFRSDRFENVAKMAKDGKVPEDGVFLLEDIKDSQQSQKPQNDP
jgi:hypothetical protein